MGIEEATLEIAHERTAQSPFEERPGSAPRRCGLFPGSMSTVRKARATRMSSGGERGKSETLGDRNPHGGPSNPDPASSPCVTAIRIAAATR
jgi:hypothetical protein